MADHLQLTVDGREETIAAPLAPNPSYTAEPLFASAPTLRGSLAFTWDDDTPHREPMRPSGVRHFRP